MRLPLIALFALGLTLLGFAHQPRADARPGWVLALVASGDLCLAPDEAPQPHADCPLCQLASGLCLPDPALTLHEADLRQIAEVVRPQIRRAAHPVLDPAHPPQGPPALV